MKKVFLSKDQNNTKVHFYKDDPRCKIENSVEINYDEIVGIGFEECHICHQRKNKEILENTCSESLLLNAETKSNLKIAKSGATVTFHTNFYTSQTPDKSLSTLLGITTPCHFILPMLVISFDHVSHQGNALMIEIEAGFKDKVSGHLPSQHINLVCSYGVRDAEMIFQCSKSQELYIKIARVFCDE